MVSGFRVAVAQAVADPLHGDDVALAVRRFELAAEGGDVGVDGPLARLALRPPGPDQLAAAERPAGMAGQGGEEAVRAGAERHLPPRHAHPVAARIDLQLADALGLGGGAPG